MNNIRHQYTTVTPHEDQRFKKNMKPLDEYKNNNPAQLQKYKDLVEKKEKHGSSELMALTGFISTSMDRA